MSNLNHIYTELKLDNTHELYFINKNTYTQKLPQRVISSLNEMNIKPESIFIFNNKPIILFFNNSSDLEKIHRQCWNFSEAPIIIIENETDFDVYNGFDYIISKDKFELKTISKNNLDYLTIINGEYFRTSKKAFETKNKIDKWLLKNIKNARARLLEEGLIKYKDIANSLIGRIIFIRYLIDRKVKLNFDGNSKKLTNNELKEILDDKEKTYDLFKYLKSDEGFNGDWFPIVNNERNIVEQKHLKIMKDLISGTEIKTGQQSLFDIYDFSIIPIEFISNVYESFIGEKEQSKQGAYYTPTFLVDYILHYTMDEFYKKNPKKYNCKVFDPACGSGIFLVEALRKLIAQYEKVKDEKIQPSEIIKLVKHNIYGLDKDKSAVGISVFSLYLTMLDYQNPKDIEEFTFPYLLKSDKNEYPNFFKDDFFNVGAEYNDIIKKEKIDFIIGNPPYGRSTIKKGSFADKYVKSKKLSIGNADIVQPFMIRIKDLVGENTKISFIVTSKVLYNLQTKEFRTKHFFNQFKVNHILELSSVRKEIFENANTPVSIMFYEHSSEKEVFKNTINYISMKPSPYFEKLKILILAKSDFKKVSQRKLLEYDYLWKILVYGSYLDFNFIKRLKKSYATVDNYIQSKAQGLTVGGSDKNSTKEYIGMSYIQTKQFKPFFIDKSNLVWEKEFAHRNKSLKLFKAPSLLISKGISSTLDLKVGIVQKDSIFTDSITALKNKNKDELYGIMGTLYSSFFKYFIINTGTSIGIEREQIHNPEKFSLPYIHNSNTIQSSKDLEEYSKNDFAQYDKEFNDLKDALNQNIFKAFDLTEQEYALIDYSTQVIIPWIMQKKYDLAFQQCKYQDTRIEDYVRIFTKHYSAIYKQNDKYFQAEILWNKYAIGIYFKILNDKPDKSIVWKKEKNIKNFLKFSSGKTLENLFIQKDIKGFESDGFYVIKPNEYKNWHKAIGYLDFYEFDDAILRARK